MSGPGTSPTREARAYSATARASSPIEVLGLQGAPLPGEVTLWLVDQAVLALAEAVREEALLAERAATA